MFSRLRFRTKLAMLLVLSVLAVVVSITCGAITVRDRMIQDRIDKLRAIVQSTISVAAGLQAQVEAKTLTHDQAIERMRDLAHLMRFDGGSGYVTVSSLDDGTVLVHGTNPSLEGKPATATDSNGRSIRALYAEALRASDDGVIYYSFPRPGETQPIPKMAYVARFKPWNAVVLSGAYTDDLDAAFSAALRRLSLIGGLILLLTLPIAALINRDIGRTLARMRDTMARLAGGDRTVAIPSTERADELGGMARALAVFKENANQMDALQLEQHEERARSVAEKRQALMNLADQFDSKVRGVVDAVANAGDAMGSAARKVSGTADAAVDQAGSALTEAEQATMNVQGVAAAIEEMATTGAEISRQVNRAATISREAAEEGRRTNDTVASLAAAAQKVGDVVKLIQDIAAQTNLLLAA